MIFLKNDLLKIHSRHILMIHLFIYVFIYAVQCELWLLGW